MVFWFFDICKKRNLNVIWTQFERNWHKYMDVKNRTWTCTISNYYGSWTWILVPVRDFFRITLEGKLQHGLELWSQQGSRYTVYLKADTCEVVAVVAAAAVVFGIVVWSWLWQQKAKNKKNVKKDLGRIWLAKLKARERKGESRVQRQE